LANARFCDYRKIPLLKPDSSRPIERFFMAIKPGNTPDNNQFSMLVLEWIDQWHALMCGDPFAGQEWPSPIAAA